MAAEVSDLTGRARRANGRVRRDIGKILTVYIRARSANGMARRDIGKMRIVYIRLRSADDRVRSTNGGVRSADGRSPGGSDKMRSNHVRTIRDGCWMSTILVGMGEEGKGLTPTVANSTRHLRPSPELKRRNSGEG